MQSSAKKEAMLHLDSSSKQWRIDANFLTFRAS